MSYEAGAAYLSLLVSVVAIFIAVRSNNKSDNLQRTIAKRDKVIDLANAWKGVNAIDPANLITPDVVTAVNALELTASLWNHDIVEKIILLQSYWSPYRDLYDTLYNCNHIPPMTKKTCRDCITSEMTRAYEEMKARQLSQVRQSSI